MNQFQYPASADHGLTETDPELGSHDPKLFGLAALVCVLMIVLVAIFKMN